MHQNLVLLKKPVGKKTSKGRGKLPVEVLHVNMSALSVPIEQRNRVVHSSHFRAIFGSFSVFIFLPFFKNELENEIKNESKMIIFQKLNPTRGAQLKSSESSFE